MLMFRQTMSVDTGMRQAADVEKRRRADARAQLDQAEDDVLTCYQQTFSSFAEMIAFTDCVAVLGQALAYWDALVDSAEYEAWWAAFEANLDAVEMPPVLVHKMAEYLTHQKAFGQKTP